MNIDFAARWYQKNVIEAWNPNNPNRKNRFVLCWARRCGKDYLAWNIAIWECLRKKQIVWYIAPTFAQCRSIIWGSMTSDGRSFLSMVPSLAVEKMNESRLEIRFKNGSILAMHGSTNLDRMRGGNCTVAIFTEFADQQPEAWQLVVSPIIRAHGDKGSAWFLSTPKGQNWFYQLCELAKNDDRWVYDFKTVKDTGHIDLMEIERDVNNGLISREQCEQEYFCSFLRGRSGQVYGGELARLRLEERVSYVPYEEGHLTHVAADIGWDDDTALIFFQVIGQTIKIIDCYSNRQKDLSHYAQVIYEKGYTLGKVFLPHDARQHSIETGRTREEKLHDLGLNIEILPMKRVIDRLEDGKTIFARAWIDESKCQPLLKALEQYHREWNERLQRYNDLPTHDNSSHFADAWSYMAVAIKEHSFTNSLTQQDINELRAKARREHNPYEIKPLVNPNVRY